jgi:hypothetical protein
MLGRGEPIEEGILLQHWLCSRYGRKGCGEKGEMVKEDEVAVG